MAKGQLRSNREAKKPKQPKKPAPVWSPSGSAPGNVRSNATTAQAQKKH